MVSSFFKMAARSPASQQELYHHQYSLSCGGGGFMPTYIPCDEVRTEFRYIPFEEGPHLPRRLDYRET